MCSGGRETGPTKGSGAFWAGCREAQRLQERAELCISHGLAERWGWPPCSRMGVGGDIPSGNLPKPLLSPLCFQPLLCPVAVGSTACTCTITEFALLGLKPTPAHFTGCSLGLGQRERAKVHSFSSCCALLTRAQTPRCIPLCHTFLRLRSPTAFSLS